MEQSYEQRNMVVRIWELETLGTTGRNVDCNDCPQWARFRCRFVHPGFIQSRMSSILKRSQNNGFGSIWLVVNQDVAPGPFCCTWLPVATYFPIKELHHFAAQVSCSDAGLGLAGARNWGRPRLPVC